MGLGKRKWRGIARTKLIAASIAMAMCAVLAVIAIGPAFVPPVSRETTLVEARVEAEGANANTPGVDASVSERSESAEKSYTQCEDEGDNPAEFEPGFMLASLASGVSADEALEALSSIPELSGISIAETIDDLVRLELPSTVSVRKAVSLVEAVEEIDFAQPNYRYYPVEDKTSSAQNATDTLMASATIRSASALQGTSLGSALIAQIAANDPFYDEQWHLSSINAPDAWAAVNSAGATTTTVAVIDAGFLTSHEDLAGNVVAEYDAAAKKNAILPDNARSSQVDHGTHCAGVIAAIANNEKGITGVTANTCKVLPVRIQDQYNRIYTSYLTQAFSYLAAQQATYNIRVVSMSLGAPSSSRATRMTDRVIYDAIQKSYDAGMAIVVAACNDNDADPPYYAYPSDFDNAISVIALQSTNSNADGVKRASYSNYNVSGQIAKNVSAPGSSILSLLAFKNRDFSSPYFNTLYDTMNGTSMAAPVVAGVMGLMFAANPDLTVSEATSKLYSTTKDLTKSSGTSSGWDAETGFGEIDAAGATSAESAYLTGATAVSVGKTKTLEVEIAGAKQAASEWTWSSSNPEIATVNASGQVSGVEGGQVIITAKKGSLKAQQVLTVQIPAKLFTVAIPQASNRYTGKACKPVPTVYYNGEGLKENRDYTVSYKNNVNAGKAYVVITGVAPYYTGTVKKAFKITKAAIGKARIVLSAKTLSYNGKKQMPKVAVYDIKKNKAVKLKKGVDYKVSGSGVKRGTGKLKITAKKACSNFKGSVTKTFRVK